MRARLIFIVVALLLAAGFAGLNWAEFTRSAPLSFGVFVTEASVGLVMLALFGVTVLMLLLGSAMHESRHMIEMNRHGKALQAQRELAEKAEASRFTDLRQYMDMQLRENRQREAIVETDFDEAMIQIQRELRTQLDQVSRTLAGRLGELEGRIEARLERMKPNPDLLPRETVTL